MSARRLLTVVLFTAAVAAVGIGAARGDGSCGGEREVRPEGFTSEYTYRRLQEIYAQIEAGAYSEVYQRLPRVLERAGNRYERAVIAQAQAQLAVILERYDEAAAHFERAIALDALPDREHYSLFHQLARLYGLMGRNREALAALETWLCKAHPDDIVASAYALQASLHADLGDYRTAVTAIDKAIDAGTDPPESWFLMKLGAHFELEQYPRAARTLEQVIARWPENRIYWVQLTQILMTLKQEKRALAVLSLAYRKGLLRNESDLKYLARLYTLLDIPYSAAEVLEKGLEEGVIQPSRINWEMAGNAWLAAEETEKALQALEIAGDDQGDGTIDLRRGFLLVDLGRWREARAALTTAIGKGGLGEADIGQAYLLRGVCELRLENLRPARQDFGNAWRYDGTRAAAEEWIRHLRNRSGAPGP